MYETNAQNQWFSFLFCCFTQPQPPILVSNPASPLAQSPPPPAPPPSGDPWVPVVDSDGDAFFVHRVTGELRWEHPDRPSLPPAPPPAAAALPRSSHLHHAVLEARALSLKAEAAAAQSRSRAAAAGAAAAGALARTLEEHASARRGLGAARAAVLLRAAVLHKPRHAPAEAPLGASGGGPDGARAAAAGSPPSPRDLHVASLRDQIARARAAVEHAEGRVDAAFAKF
jgi:hypothetical protein